MVKVKSTVSLLLLSLSLWWSATVVAQGTAFTYQGKLTDSGNLANGTYDFQFKLFDMQTVGTGTQIGSLVAVPNVTVTNGIFTVQLDFGACPTCFNGAARFLEIAVKPTSGSTFTTLGPRQPITATPYAIKSQNATTADSLSVFCSSCVTSSQIQSVNGSAVTGTIPVASVPAGSANYIQNGTSQQAASNFNISGTGTADILNATTQFNTNGLRVLSVAGLANLFAGIEAGTTNSGSNNAFFGTGTGQFNTTGSNNAFFGRVAGQFNSTGSSNAFFGDQAGGFNHTGSNNAFFGFQSGIGNDTGMENVFFGNQAGQFNTSGSSNVFLGSVAGFSNTSGGSNTFIGKHADFSGVNPIGNNNTLLGAFANASQSVSNATAIGAFAQVSQSNSLVLGGISGVSGTSVNVGIGTTAPQFRLDVVGDINIAGAINSTTQYNLGGLRVLSVAGGAGSNNLFAGINAGTVTTGFNNAFFGFQAGQANTTGFNNAFFGRMAGNANTTGQQNAFFGDQAGGFNTTGNFNTFFGEQAGRLNNIGSNNAFFGRNAGDQNSNGNNNAFFGSLAGVANAGSSNTFIGTSADFNAASIGSNNTLLGALSRVTANINNATAIGAQAQVSQNNSLVLGSINGVNGATADTNVGIGTISPTTRLHVVGNGLFTGNLTVNGTLTANLPGGSANYIQNGTSPQAASNFNISGNGTAGGNLTAGLTMSANMVNATTQYNLGGSRLLTAAGTGNLFVGIIAGTTGSNNAFFGNAAGNANVGGNANAFFGQGAGMSNNSGSANVFLGQLAGNLNSSGNNNVFLGQSTGSNNATGSNNTFIGKDADFNVSSPAGNNNSLLGALSIVTSGSSNATAIGFRAQVTQSNSLVLGAIDGVNSATSDTTVGIGTTAPVALLDVQRDNLTIPEVARFTTYGNTANDILGRSSNGSRAAPAATPSGRILLQLGATGHDGTAFVSSPKASIQLITSENWTPTAQGTNILFLTTTNGTTSTTTKLFIKDDGKVGIGTTTPDQLLSVNGGASKSGGGSWSTFSDARLKTIRGTFTAGLQAVMQLQPIRYEYKADNALGITASGEQIGFVAQEVEKVIPEAVSRNGRGYLLVNNDPILWAMLNAVKELKAENDALKQKLQRLTQQQQQITQQQQQITKQQQEMAAIKTLLCKSQPRADLCTAKPVQ